MMKYFVDIEIHDTKDGYSQAKYLVHGIDDVFWTDNLEDAFLFLKEGIEKEENKNVQ